MGYFRILGELFRGRPEIFKLALEHKARKAAVLNYLILGALFGLSNLAGLVATETQLPMEGKFALITPLLFALTGILIILSAILGLCLIYWAAAKAFGGWGNFPLIFDLLGLAAPPFWVLAPLLNYLLRTGFSGSGAILFLPVGLAIACSALLIRHSLVVGQGITPVKSAFAVAGMGIFSLSSVYVFLP